MTVPGSAPRIGSKSDVFLPTSRRNETVGTEHGSLG
jgi:hypothetical protein